MAASTAPVAQMARLALALAMVLPGVAADKATTNAEATLPPYFGDFTMVVAINPSEAGPVPNEYPVVPLTREVGLNGTQTTLAAIKTTGSLVNVDQSNFNLFNDSGQIAYVSCDSVPEQSNISPSDVLNSLMEGPTKPEAILLYTTSAAYCSLDGTNLAYQSIWSMVSSESAWGAKNLTSASAGTVRATIEGNDTANGSDSGDGSTGGNNSAVAMSILYSITGLITLLFLVIIATGAVRAHRHPERYGPRAGYGGRARQSRARGLARAVLDTIPIVKFGDQHPVKGDPDQELESIPGDRHQDSPVPMQTKPMHETVVGVALTPGSNATEQERTTPNATGSVANSAAGNEPVHDEHLGCTICTEDFEVGEDMRVLPCDHKFHPACVDPWLINVSGTCPLCRLDLRPQGAHDDTAHTEEPPNHGDGEGVQGHAEDAEAVQVRRRSRLLDWNRLRHASVDERIQALRQIREQEQSTSPRSPTSDTTQHTTLTNRLREKFHIRTRTQA
ncbi:hypothetical protein JX266_011050 [Neoarthrinium moseri]|uniref:uncharacterized protein n=1 Tax=Neoarthrinium moseri TaxID=1658444 RepID=UPI001FDB208A|nr:uncharacterized protein JN550_009221 [Neoarthrinium moseri]KAI1842729.1 hypothetical protein JX266_011050 [Neoarthrinium moseri]KAI1863942.1 hypothetical protein JN550_009221 [Neoarthrinium moseri]